MRAIIALQRWIIREVSKPRPRAVWLFGQWMLAGMERDERGINERLRAIERINSLH